MSLKEEEFGSLS